MVITLYFRIEYPEEYKDELNDIISRMNKNEKFPSEELREFMKRENVELILDD